MVVVLVIECWSDRKRKKKKEEEEKESGNDREIRKKKEEERRGRIGKTNNRDKIILKKIKKIIYIKYNV